MKPRVYKGKDEYGPYWAADIGRSEPVKHFTWKAAMFTVCTYFYHFDLPWDYWDK